MLLYYHCRQCRGGPCVRPQKQERTSLSPTASTPCNGTLLIAFVLVTALFIGQKDWNILILQQGFYLVPLPFLSLYMPLRSCLFLHTQHQGYNAPLHNQDIISAPH